MGKTFNASVDWLGMVENPDQDVNSVEEVNAVAQTGMEMMSNEIPEVEIHSLTKESYDKLSDAQKQVYDSYKGLQYSPFRLSDKSEGSLHYLDALDMVEGSQVGNIFNEPHINAPKGIKMDEHGLFRAHAYPNPFSYATQGGLISDYISSGDIYIPSVMTYDRQSKTFLKKKYGTDDSRKIYMNKLIAELAHVDPDVRQTILEQVMTEGDRLRRAYNESYLPHLDFYTKMITLPHTIQNLGQYKKAFWPDKSNYSSYGDYEYHTHYGPESAERALIEKYSKQPYSGITTEGTYKHLDKQQEGNEFTLEPRTDEEVMDSKLLSPAEYQKRISDHHNKFHYAYSSGQRKYPEADESWGEGWDDRYPEWSWAHSTGKDGKYKAYKTPHHSSGITEVDSENRPITANCIHGVCYYALDAGVESLADQRSPRDGQFTSNAEFFDKYGDNEGFVIDHNPFDGRTYGPDFIYAGDIIQLLTQPGDQHDRADVTLGDHRPRHAYMVVDAGNPTQSMDRRVITLGHNSGGDIWKTEKYLLKDVLNNFSEKLWVLNAYDPEQVVANKNLKEKDRLALEGQHKFAKYYLNRNPDDYDFRPAGYGMGGTDKELMGDKRYGDVEDRGILGNQIYTYSDGTDIDYLGSGWILETYNDYYTTLGKIADMPPKILDGIVLDQIGIRTQESSKNPKRYLVSDIAKTAGGKTAKKIYNWISGDKDSWEEDYWARNVKDVQDKYENIEEWIKDMYSRDNKSARISYIEQQDSPLSRGPFQQKSLSTRGRYILRQLTGKENVNFKDDVLGGPQPRKSNYDNRGSRAILASIALAMDNWHMLKRHHEKLGTKINGKPLTNAMLVSLATLAHNAPRKAMTKEFVEYYFANYLNGKTNDEGGIDYLDKVDLYKGYLVNRHSGKAFDPLKTRYRTSSRISASRRDHLYQDGGPVTPRDKYIQFALDTESGQQYIRAKDSAVKKLGPDGKWDGKTYYKIFEDGKYYPHYVGDEKRATIGHGHSPVDRDIFEEYKGGITKDEALKLLNKDIDEKLRLSEIYYNQRFGDNKWSELTDDEKYMLNDYTFNVRGGFRKTFKKFAKAIHDKDYELAKKEYKRALGERNKIFMDRYLKPWMDIQKEKTTIAPPLDELPLPFNTFPTDGEGNPQSMSTNPNQEPKKETSWWRGEEGWIPDELELPWFMDGAGINARGGAPQSSTEIADGSRAENASMSRSAMPPLPNLNNDLTVNDNLALSNTIADLSEETTIAKYGGQYNWGLDLRSTKAQAGKEVKSDDIYSNDRYSHSASKYKILPKYQDGKGGDDEGPGYVDYSVNRLLPEVEIKEKDPRNWIQKNYQKYISPIGHGALDVLGMVPLFGEVADGLNAAWYLGEGNKTDAALSAAAMIPFFGWGATAGKWAKNTYKAMDKITDGGGDLFLQLKRMKEINPTLAKNLKFKNNRQIKKMLKNDPKKAEEIVGRHGQHVSSKANFMDNVRDQAKRDTKFSLDYYKKYNDDLTLTNKNLQNYIDRIGRTPGSKGGTTTLYRYGTGPLNTGRNKNMGWYSQDPLAPIQYAQRSDRTNLGNVFAVDVDNDLLSMVYRGGPQQGTGFSSHTLFKEFELPDYMIKGNFSPGGVRNLGTIDDYTKYLNTLKKYGGGLK